MSKYPAVYARLREEANNKYIYSLMGEGHTMREILERMITFCRESKSFRMPPKKAKVEKMLESHEKRKEHYKKLAEE